MRQARSQTLYSDRQQAALPPMLRGHEHQSTAANGAWVARSVCEPPISSLDQIVAKLETDEPLRLNGVPASWGGKAQLVYRSRRLTERMRRRMITLRLSQLASQHANDRGGLKLTRSFKPRAEGLSPPSLSLDKSGAQGQPNAWSRRSTMLNPSCSRP